jgi:hypothetical protein
MKKIAKLSLVAAVAVAGLTTTATAGALETAVKNTDISGQFRYRLQDQNVNTTNTDVEIEVGVKSKVTDNVTAVFKIDNAPNNREAVSTDALDVEDYYFSYANDGLTVNFGQHNLPTRQVDGAQGDGVSVMKTMGTVTLGAGYFVNNSATSNENVTLASVKANMGGVSAALEYIDIADDRSGYNVLLAGKAGPVSLSLSHAEREDDNSTNQDSSTTKLSVGGKVGPAAIKAMYVATGDTSGAALDGADAAGTELETFRYGTGGQAEASVVVLSVTVPVAAKTSVTLFGMTGDGSTNTDVEEFFAQVSYKAAKNLNTYVRYGTYELGTAESDRYRFEAKYSF